MSVTGSATPVIGMVGVGNMGMPVARRLGQAGYPLRVFARRPEVRAEVRQLGAVVEESLAAVGRAADVVIVNVFSDSQVREVAFGSGGLLANMRAGAVLVNHTTGRPSTAQALAAEAAAREIDTLDCAMSGGPDDIDAGRLTLLVGGAVDVLEGVRPVLSSYSSPVLRVGEVGDGQKVKLLNNALFAAQVALVVSTERCAAQMGMEPGLVLPAIRECSADSYALGAATAIGSAERLVEAARRYLEKDVAVCAEVAEEIGADLTLVLDVARRI